MAVTLTKNYQKISTISLTYGEIRTYAKYTSQNSSTNKTTYYLKSTYYTSYQSLSFDSATAKLDGTSKSYGYTSLGNGETTLQEVSRTLTHNNDGSSPDKSISTSWSATFGGSGSTSATIKMPKINRYATITSAPNFNDTENPTIKYSNPAGNSVSSLQVCIASTDGMTTYANYRDVSKTGTSYTFNLTETERDNLRYASRNTSGGFSLKFFIKTVINGTTYRENVTKTLTIVNANPTEITTFEETNQKVIDILGSSTADTIIQNVSSLKLTSTPTVLKSATVSKIQFQHNNVIVAKTSSPYEYTFKPVNSVFKTTITDSRGYVVSNEYTKDIIEYLPIEISSFSFKRANPTSSNIVLNAQIRYKQTTFSERDNVPTIQWKCGENGELNTLTTEDYTLDTENNRITISNLTLSDILPYTQESRFYLYASDLLTEDTENEPVLKGIPTCDMGEHDFQVNGKLYIADESRTNKIDVGNNIEKNAMTIRSNNSNINLSVDTAWQYYNIPLSISNATDKVGSGKISYDSTNKCIVIGEETNHVKVSGSALIRGISSTLLFGIKLNSSVVAQAYGIPTSSTSTWQSIYSTDVILSVSEGDRIYLLAGAGATGTLNIGSANYTYLTVEKLD